MNPIDLVRLKRAIRACHLALADVEPTYFTTSSQHLKYDALRFDLARLEQSFKQFVATFPKETEGC
jgi:hypothetical protein